MDGKLQVLILCAICFLTSEEALFKSDHNKISKRCTKCPPGWGVIRKCTITSDTQCVRCMQGRTYSPHHSYKSPCWLCSQCGVGLYESHKCSTIRDTICSECISYLDHKNVSSTDFFNKCSYMFLE